MAIVRRRNSIRCSTRRQLKIVSIRNKIFAVKLFFFNLCEGRVRSSVLLALAFLLLACALLFLFYSQLELSSSLARLNERFDVVVEKLDEVAEKSEEARNRASGAEEKAELAARLRKDAEERAEQSRLESLAAKREAMQAREEAERIRREREAELNRLQESLNRIAETRRTALGLVMNLDSDFIQFAFDDATLTPGHKELLSRIVGILLTSSDYRVQIHGHTDDIGNDEYNLKLSERRAQAVRDYMVEAGLNPDIITIKGFGKTRPMVPETSPRARAKNRRVEIAIVDMSVQYQGPVGEK